MLRKALTLLAFAGVVTTSFATQAHLPETMRCGRSLSGLNITVGQGCREVCDILAHDFFGDHDRKAYKKACIVICSDTMKTYVKRQTQDASCSP